jgi:hypothetical protein
LSHADLLALVNIVVDRRNRDLPYCDSLASLPEIKVDRNFWQLVRFFDRISTLDRVMNWIDRLIELAIRSEFVTLVLEIADLSLAIGGVDLIIESNG